MRLGIDQNLVTSLQQQLVAASLTTIQRDCLGAAIDSYVAAHSDEHALARAFVLTGAVRLLSQMPGADVRAYPEYRLDHDLTGHVGGVRMSHDVGLPVEAGLIEAYLPCGALREAAGAGLPIDNFLVFIQRNGLSLGGHVISQEDASENDMIGVRIAKPDYLLDRFRKARVPSMGVRYVGGVVSAEDFYHDYSEYKARPTSIAITSQKAHGHIIDGTSAHVHDVAHDAVIFGKKENVIKAGYKIYEAALICFGEEMFDDIGYTNLIADFVDLWGVQHMSDLRNHLDIFIAAIKSSKNVDWIRSLPSFLSAIAGVKGLSAERALPNPLTT